MNTKDYAKTLKSVIDAEVYTTVVMSLGKQLNDRKDRFDKADIIEQTVESASDNRLRWVDDIGRDHHDDVADLDIEFRSRECHCDYQQRRHSRIPSSSSRWYRSTYTL
jgi:hypothetical protein